MSAPKRKAPEGRGCKGFQAESRNYKRTGKMEPITGITIPDGARAMLVASCIDTGVLVAQPVLEGQSVLNIGRDLMAHLNEYPYPDSFLETLRDYCDARLTARAEAKASRRVIMPSGNPAKWQPVMSNVAKATKSKG